MGAKKNISGKNNKYDSFKTVQEPLRVIQKAIENLRYAKKARIAIDASGNNLISATKNESYKEYMVNRETLSSTKLLHFYMDLVKQYNVRYLEDPFADND